MADSERPKVITVRYGIRQSVEAVDTGLVTDRN